MPTEFFKPRVAAKPTIYAYELIGVSSHAGYLKVGYTDRTAPLRINEQTHTVGLKYRIV